MKRTTVVIPNWNGRKYLDTCLASLRTQTEKEFAIILVDNGSGDGSVSFVREHFPEVRIVRSKENTGFSGAVNAGIRRCDTEYVILLNNDVRCDPDFVRALSDGIAARPKAFSCQAKMLQMHDPARIDDAGDSFSALGWAYARGKDREAQRYHAPKRIFSACAGAAIYRRELFEKTGWFDRRHFAYLEDVDLGYRARLLGYENWFLPDALVWHAGSGASGSRHNAFKVRLSARNSLWVVRKNMPGWQIALNAPLLAAGIAVKLAFFAGKGLGRPYLKGLGEGFFKYRFDERLFPGRRLVRPGRHLALQLELWGNTLRRFG